MKKWEYTMRIHYMVKRKLKGSSILAIPSYYASDIWERKDKNGKTIWEDIKEMGKEGWEMISCVPLVESRVDFAGTEGFLFILKRPIMEDVSEDDVPSKKALIKKYEKLLKNLEKTLKEKSSEEAIKRGGLPPKG